MFILRIYKKGPSWP